MAGSLWLGHIWFEYVIILAVSVHLFYGVLCTRDKYVEHDTIVPSAEYNPDLYTTFPRLNKDPRQQGQSKRSHNHTEVRERGLRAFSCQTTQSQVLEERH